MRILQINKFFHIVGGPERYFFEVSRFLEKYQHEVAYFSMENKKNYNNEWSKYFISHCSFEKLDLSFFTMFLRMLFSIEAYEKIQREIDNFHPDLIHLHSIYHHISPSILLAIKKRNIPVVHTLGDYHLISPNYHLFHDNKICETTKQRKYYKAIFHRCVKNSYFASFAEVIEKYIHCWLGWEINNVDYFLVPTRFMRNKLIEYGLSPQKLIYFPHFIDSEEYSPSYKLGDYILYFGRLSPEKGVIYLIKAMKMLPDIKLLIVGRGDKNYENQLKIQSSNLKNVKYVKFKDGYELKRLITNSRFTILPSIWYEVFGLSILESFASGKPVIVSNIGGIPETVRDGFNGFLVEPGNIDDLADKIGNLWNNPALCKRMGKNAREYVEKYYDPKDHYDNLVYIYNKTIKSHSL